MSRVRFGVGTTSVELSDDLSGLVESVLDRVVPGVREAFDRETTAIYEEARRRWPVKTGRSREGLVHGIRIRTLGDGDVIEGFVGNTVDYARYIRTSAASGSDAPHPMTDLLRRPMLQASERMIATLGPELARRINAGGVLRG